MKKQRGSKLERASQASYINISTFIRINLQEQLVVAIDQGDIDLFEKLGGKRIDINFEITSEGIFPLLFACSKGNKNIISMILENPTADINKTDKYGVNAFWMASFYGHIEIMRFLMSKGIDLMCKNQNGSNALHIAVKKSNKQVIQTLIDINYPLDYTKNNGVSAIGIAAYKGSVEIIEMLAQAGADINQTSKRGVNPLYLAIKGNQIESIQHLLLKKAKIHLKDPVMESYSPLFYSIKEGKLYALKLICEKGFIPENFHNSNGFNPLQFACLFNNPSIVDYLTLASTNLQLEDPEGFTPLARCIVVGNLHSVQTILTRGGMDFNMRNQDGKTALTLGVQHNKIESVRFLLGQGADPHIEDNLGRDTCYYAQGNSLFQKFPVFKKCPHQGYPQQTKGLPKVQPKSMNNYQSNTDIQVRKVSLKNLSNAKSVSKVVGKLNQLWDQAKPKMLIENQSELSMVNQKSRNYNTMSNRTVVVDGSSGYKQNKIRPNRSPVEPYYHQGAKQKKSIESERQHHHHHHSQTIKKEEPSGEYGSAKGLILGNPKPDQIIKEGDKLPPPISQDDSIDAYLRYHEVNNKLQKKLKLRFTHTNANKKKQDQFMMRREARQGIKLSNLVTENIHKLRVEVEDELSKIKVGKEGKPTRRVKVVPAVQESKEKEAFSYKSALNSRSKSTLNYKNPVLQKLSKQGKNYGQGNVSEIENQGKATMIQVKDEKPLYNPRFDSYLDEIKKRYPVNLS